MKLLSITLRMQNLKRFMIEIENKIKSISESITFCSFGALKTK
jgi:hypothetical protein